MSEVDEAWKDNLPEDYRNTTLIKEVKSIEDLAKMAVESQRLLGGSIRIPGEGASEDDQAAFRQKLLDIGMIPKEGAATFLRPAEAEHYKLAEAPEDAAQIGLTQANIDNLKTRAYDMGLSNDQFQDYASKFIEDVRATFATQREKFENTDSALKAVWGEDSFQGKKQQALAAIRRFGGNDTLERMGANPDPDMLLMFAEIGKQFEESGMGDLTTPVYTTETREEASVKLDEITNNKEHAFNRGEMAAGKAAFKAASAEVMRLRRLSMGLPAKQADDMFAEA